MRRRLPGAAEAAQSGEKGEKALSVRDAGHRWWGEKAIGPGGKVE